MNDDPTPQPGVADATRAPTRASSRVHDLVLYGATGFVGRQTVVYIASHPGVKAAGLRWAMAGRNRGKLEQVQREVGGAAMEADIVTAAADDAAALDALAAGTGVVLSTAGPFALYGSALVAACVKHGTHYVDITGETPWVRELIDRHHLRAAESGARIIPFCGFDSVPSDLGARMMSQAMLARHRAPCTSVKAGFSMRGGLNGGTFASVVNILGGPGAKSFSDPFLLNPAGVRPPQSAARADPVLPHYDADFKAWMAPFFMAPINTRVVRRSAALLGYGSGFQYDEYLRVGRGVFGGAGAMSLSAGMGAGQAVMAFSPVRKLTGLLAPKPGEGPSEAAMNGGWFRCELVARSAAGNLLRGRVSGTGDPGNRATTKMVCEAALALAIDADRLPGGAHVGGVLTPAAGLGDLLATRLRAAGLTLEVDG
jgi:short subunit dehydrogenase-like uncharacterized protein